MYDRRIYEGTPACVPSLKERRTKVYLTIHVSIVCEFKIISFKMLLYRMKRNNIINKFFFDRLKQVLFHFEFKEL